MNINLKCPINSLGYGITGINVLKSLINLDNDVAHFPIGQTTIEFVEDARYLDKATANQKKFDYNAPCLKIWHQFDMAEKIGKKNLYGMPIFELDTFRDFEVHHLDYCDAIIVPSQWAKDIIHKHLPNKKCAVAPLGVNQRYFYPKFDVITKKCIFFNCGKWEIRKGHDIIAEIFLETFSDTDDVELWMMCDNPFFDETETKEWEQLYTNPKIRLIHRVQSQAELSNIMQATTCGLFPSRGEGWNLEVLEMMACGKPVITTNYSGHTEFCNEENAYLIDIDKLETAYDGKWFHGYGNWAYIGNSQKEQMAKYMRDIFQKWSNINNIVNTKGIETASKFTWENTVLRILDFIQEVENG